METSVIKQVEQSKSGELVAESKRTEIEAKLITFKDPMTLIPHPVSASLYGEIDEMEIRGWRADKSPFLNDNTSIIQRMDVTDLLKSIGRDGILVPLIINDDGVIISGSRRWIAALKLGLPSVPVEVRSFKNESEEKQAILDYNRYREKSFSQKMREAQLLKEIEAKKAKRRMLAGRRDPTLTSGEGYSPKRHERETAVIVAARMQMRKDTFRKGEKVWNEAKEGNEEAAKYVKAMDDETKSVNSAFLALKKAVIVRDEPKLSELQRAESVDSGEVVTCPQCRKSLRLLHLSRGRHKLVEC